MAKKVNNLEEYLSSLVETNEIEAFHFIAETGHEAKRRRAEATGQARIIMVSDEALS